MRDLVTRESRGETGGTRPLGEEDRDVAIIHPPRYDEPPDLRRDEIGLTVPRIGPHELNRFAFQTEYRQQGAIRVGRVVLAVVKRMENGRISEFADLSGV